MIVRSAIVGLVLLSGSAARAEEPEDKSLTEQAREQANARMRELRESERAARQKLREAERKVKQAEQDLKVAAADAKAAAEKALSDAKKALEAAHAEVHGATDKALGKAAEIKEEVAEVAAKAQDEAKDAAKEATTTVRHMEAKAHELLRGAVGATGAEARRRHARRMAWRRLSGPVDRPEDVPPSVREELRRHAQRLARLQRIRTLAGEKSEPALVARVDALLARENARHDKKLAALWATLPAKPGDDSDEQDPPDEPVEEQEEQP